MDGGFSLRDLLRRSNRYVEVGFLSQPVFAESLQRLSSMAIPPKVIFWAGQADGLMVRSNADRQKPKGRKSWLGSIRLCGERWREPALKVEQDKIQWRGRKGTSWR